MTPLPTTPRRQIGEQDNGLWITRDISIPTTITKPCSLNAPKHETRTSQLAFVFRVLITTNQSQQPPVLVTAKIKAFSRLHGNKLRHWWKNNDCCCTVRQTTHHNQFPYSPSIYQYISLKIVTIHNQAPICVHNLQKIKSGSLLIYNTLWKKLWIVFFNFDLFH